MNDFEIIFTLIEKYIIGQQLDITTLETMMLRNGMTETEHCDFVKAVQKLGKGKNGWPKFVISAVRNSNEEST